MFKSIFKPIKIKEKERKSIKKIEIQENKYGKIKII